MLSGSPFSFSMHYCLLQADISGAPSFASTPMSSAAHHAAEQQEHHFPTASSAQSSDIHADPQHYSGKAERYDDDGILLESAEPSRQVWPSA